MVHMREPALLLTLFIAAPAVAQNVTLPLWPNGNPEPSKVVGPEIDPTAGNDPIVSGLPKIRVTNVSHPSLTLYPADPAKSNGAAALVFPGGAYLRLSMNLEGSEVCQWLNPLGIACIVVKYRVPEDGHFPKNTEDLEDAQQAMRLTRAHAAQWHIDPARIGVIGFSAGAHLAVVLSTHPDFAGPTAPAGSPDLRPAFQMVLYPGYLTDGPATVKNAPIDPALAPPPNLPPTFLIQAEDDYDAHVENSLVYFNALKDAKIPVEMHLFTQGGHGFGLRPTELPISHWPALAETWLKTIHILGPPAPIGRP